MIFLKICFYVFVDLFTWDSLDTELEITWNHDPPVSEAWVLRLQLARRYVQKCGMRSSSCKHVELIQGLASLRPQEGYVWGCREKGIYKLRLSEEEQSNTGKRKRYFSQRKDTKKTFVYLLENIISLLEKWDHFLTCLNKPKLWTKWSLFKTGCSSWSLVCIKKKLQEIYIYIHINIYFERQIH